MKCILVEQGYKPGSCLTQTEKGKKSACRASLKRDRTQWSRLIKSAHLSRQVKQISYELSRLVKPIMTGSGFSSKKILIRLYI